MDDQTHDQMHERNPFALKDCALVALATGRRAQNLRELRDHLVTVDSASIYYHFWGCLLRPRFDDPEYNNDFAVWIRHGLNDLVLAERLAVVDPTQYEEIEDLREDLVDLIEERLDEIEWPTWAKMDNQFHFLRSQIVVFDTNVRIDNPEGLPDTVNKMSAGSVFYHFIDARRRNADKVDDFRAWLAGENHGYAGLVSALAEVDPYFFSLVELRRRLLEVFTGYFAAETADPPIEEEDGE